MRSSCKVALLALFQQVGVGAAGEPGWGVGWGFLAHNGFPALPDLWQNYNLSSSGVGYFLGNASGNESDAEHAAEDRFGIVGLGWQLNNIPSHYSHVEEYEIAEAKRLKSLRKDVKIMVTRETQVTTVFYDMARKAMYDPETQDYWTQCGGKPCSGVWASPAGHTPKFYFNFSNPRLADWWVDEFVGSAVRNPLFDGVYFDCSCGASPGDNLNQTQMQADAQVAFDRALDMIAARGKWASAWNSDGEFKERGCASQVKRWISMGADDSHTLQIQASAFRDKGQGKQEQLLQNNTIAAFMVSRGKSATLEFPVLGAYGSAVTYGWSPLLDTDFGVPLGPAVESPAGLFTRKWSKATITLDCNGFHSSFVPVANVLEISV